eukprot:m51a1_g12707 hypothetical protein (301) ;mRNA; f:55-1095
MQPQPLPLAPPSRRPACDAFKAPQVEENWGENAASEAKGSQEEAAPWAEGGDWGAAAASVPSDDDVLAKLRARDASVSATAADSAPSKKQKQPKPAAAKKTPQPPAPSAPAAGAGAGREAAAAPAGASAGPACLTFEGVYLEFGPEPKSGQTALDRRALELLERYKREGGEICADEGAGCEGGAGDADRYERFSGDKAFARFQQRMLRSESQVVRYEVGGEPLQLSDAWPLPREAEVPACEHCGSRRVFEAQLLPTLAGVLEQQPGGEALDVGTVVVYSCPLGCGGACVRDEFVFAHNSI